MQRLVQSLWTEALLIGIYMVNNFLIMQHCNEQFCLCDGETFRYVCIILLFWGKHSRSSFRQIRPFGWDRVESFEAVLKLQFGPSSCWLPLKSTIWRKILECFPQKHSLLFDWRKKDMNILDGMRVSKLSGFFLFWKWTATAQNKCMKKWVGKAIWLNSSKCAIIAMLGQTTIELVLL